MKLIFALAAMLFITDVSARCYQKYDYRSQNYYTICEDNKGVDLRGFNMQDGTMWNERLNRDGTYRGQDGAGNFYQGDNKTGNYYNYGTGEMCFGTGANRICTGGDVRRR